MKRFFATLFIVGVLGAIAFFSRISIAPTQNIADSAAEMATTNISVLPVINIRIKDTTIQAEVVKTPQELTKGLGNRTSLEEGIGMWFDFGSKIRRGIWMKDMQFPIDIVWFDENRIIIDFKTNVGPETFPEIFYPSHDASFVLELPAGSVEKYQFYVGDQSFLE